MNAFEAFQIRVARLAITVASIVSKLMI